MANPYAYDLDDDMDYFLDMDNLEEDGSPFRSSAQQMGGLDLDGPFFHGGKFGANDMGSKSRGSRNGGGDRDRIQDGEDVEEEEEEMVGEEEGVVLVQMGEEAQLQAVPVAQIRLQTVRQQGDGHERNISLLFEDWNYMGKVGKK